MGRRQPRPDAPIHEPRDQSAKRNRVAVRVVLRPESRRLADRRPTAENIPRRYQFLDCIAQGGLGRQ